MAWITKNSAAQKVDRRAEPYLTEAMKSELEADVIPRYPTRQAATLPVLHLIQHKYHYVPYQAIEEVAAFLKLEPSVVQDTATFYEEFSFEPRGKYTIWLCQSISCELMNHAPILERIQDRLGIGPGETTEDGKFTLMAAECLGACGGAPCALINDRLYENLSEKNIDAVLDALQ
jgi:NADH-quinone oxidoreductase subunit E